MKTPITIEASVSAPLEKIWDCWTNPEHITKWNNASPDWHTPIATNDLRVGGTFMSRMEGKDGKEGFDFTGTYTLVDTNKKIEYVMDDGRKVSTEFTPTENAVKIVTVFDPETINPIDMQRAGWQSILNNFAAYVVNH